MNTRHKRLQVLEDERQILRVIHQYGEYIDYGHASEWLDLFAGDARFELHYRKGLEPSIYGTPDVNSDRLSYIGRSMLAQFIESHSHAPDKYHKHFVTGTCIDIFNDIAKCRSYFMRVDEIGGSATIVAAGRYLDTMARTPDGAWRFTCRIAEIEARRPIMPPPQAG